MKATDIGTLIKVLPDVFDLNGFEGLESDEWIVIDEAAASGSLDPIEEAIVESYSNDPSNAALDASAKFDDDYWPGSHRIRDIPLPGGLEGDFPGAPNREDPYFPPGSPPPPDRLAFYLPFHHFSRKIWGIYLIAEGVASLAHDLVRISKHQLSIRDAVIAARAFLFHHEAYHSAVEAFGTRLEVAHRERVYIGGLRTMYRRDRFEEALADGYAINCVNSRVLSHQARKLAVSALTRYVASCGRGYFLGASLVGRKVFKDAENRFLEEALQLSVPRVKVVSETVWSTASYFMMPALRRQGRFTYLVNRTSSFAKRAQLSVRYFDRRKLLQRLREEIGGREIGGGRHRKWEAKDKKVPIPYKKDIPIGTVGSILRDFEIDRRPNEFMGAKG